MQTDGQGRTPPPDAESVTAAREAAADPIRRLLAELAALREYAAHLATAQVDIVRLRARNLFVGLVMGVAFALLAWITAITATVFLIRGIAGGLAAAFGGRAWLGELLTGILILGLLAASMGLIAVTRQKRRRQMKVAKYELRKTRQRDRFGRDAEDAARNAA